jgi:hypothetical protein
MIIGKHQAVHTAKYCRDNNLCMECGTEGHYPSCDIHQEIIDLRVSSSEVLMKEALEVGKCECYKCGLDVGDVHRSMSNASKIVIKKLITNKIPNLLGTGEPIHIYKIAKYGHQAVLKKYGLEKFAIHNRIATIDEEKRIVCLNCL